MKTIAFLMMVALLLAAGCNRAGARSDGGSNTTTETIAPANAQPAQNGTDATTQTTEVEDSRSEAEGGAAAAPSPAKAKTATPAKTPAKKKKK